MEHDKNKNGVFHIYGTYTYPQAVAVALKLKCKLASWSQMIEAYENGANWCDYGWSKNQEAYYPIQKKYYESLIKNNISDKCGKPGLNGGYFGDRQLKFGINCYGLLPNLFPPDYFKNTYFISKKQLNKKD